MPYLIRILIVCGFLFCIKQSKAQFLTDGFSPESGKAVVGLSAGVNSFKKYYSAQGKAVVGRNTLIASSYLAYNPNSKIKIAASIPYLAVAGRENKGLQDAFFQVLFMPYSNNGLNVYLLSAYGTPLSDYGTESAYSIGQQAEVFAFGAGAQYTSGHYFANLAYQFQNKSTPTPASNQLQLKLGYFDGPMFYALRIEQQTSPGGSDYRDGTFRPFTTLGVNFSKASLDVYRRINPKLGVSATIGQVFAGRNTGQSTEFFLGVIWNSHKKPEQ